MDLGNLAVNGSLATMMLWSMPTPSDNLRPITAWWDSAQTGAHQRLLADPSSLLPSSEEVGYFVAQPTDDAGAKLFGRTLERHLGTGHALRLYRYLHDQSHIEKDWLTHRALLPAHAQAIKWIQSATSLSDGSIARLLGVSRMTILDWKAGKPIREKNRRRLLETQDILRRAGQLHSGPDALVAWLDTPSPADGISPLRLLQEEQYDRARYRAVQVSTGVAPVPDWAKRPIAPEWQGALEARERPGEFSEKPPPNW